MQCQEPADSRGHEPRPAAARHPHTQEPGSRPPYLSEVHLARGEDRRWLHARLRQLCEPWGTRVQDAADGRLRIPLQEAAQS